MAWWKCSLSFITTVLIVVLETHAVTETQQCGIEGQRSPHWDSQHVDALKTLLHPVTFPQSSPLFPTTALTMRVLFACALQRFVTDDRARLLDEILWTEMASRASRCRKHTHAHVPHQP